MVIFYYLILFLFWMLFRWGVDYESRFKKLLACDHKIICNKKEVSTINYYDFNAYFRPHIEVLELPREFTPAEVKEAYYKLSKRYHPDSATANPDQFLLIKEAYEALKDGHKEGPACSMSLTTDDKDKVGVITLLILLEYYFFYFNSWLFRSKNGSTITIDIERDLTK